MAFTYDLSTDIGKLRLEIGDTSPQTNEGIKPNGSYISDEELQVFLTREGSVGKAAAAVCEALGRMYARFCDLTVGPRHESLSQASTSFLTQAKALRAQYGYSSAGNLARAAVAGGIVKVDGFNYNDTASDAVTLAQGEWAPVELTVYLDY